MSSPKITDRISYLIARASRIVEDDLSHRLQGEGLAVEQFRVLRILEQEGPQAMGELAMTVLVEPATLTKIIDRMVSENLVFRLADPKDRRKVKVALAPSGTALCQSLKDIAEAHEDHVALNLLPGSAELLQRILSEMCRMPADKPQFSRAGI